MQRRARLTEMTGVLAVVALAAATLVHAQAPPAPPAAAQSTPAPSTAPATAPAAPLSKEREARLRARVAEYYAARKERDPRAMYNLLEPEYRAKNEYAAYAKATNVRLRFTLLKAEIASIAPQPDDAAVVTMALQMDLDRFGANPVEPADRWVWRDSDWWIAYQDSPLPFPK